MNDAVSDDECDRINNAHKLLSMGSDQSVSGQTTSPKSLDNEVIAP